MRLLKIKIRNIASLKGEHYINFQEIQEQSPLFAITGETGSGKSSILNSIGLALYGQVYKKNVNQIDVVTLGEKDGAIELIFQVRGKYYLADWRVRVRKQNGEPYSTPQTPSRNLYALEGTEFNSTKNIATQSVSELLNLDFDQFCKCIILNQGEFAKFLSSSFTERKDILEKLYPGELLENMSKELRAELEVLGSSKAEIEIKLGELRGDNASGADLKEEKQKLELKLIELEQSSKLIEELDYHFVSLFSYHEKFGENEKKKEQLKRDMAQETSRLNEIIKNGEIIIHGHELAKKEQETELPLLQNFLKKEETLKLLEEAWEKLQRVMKELSLQSQTLAENLQKKMSEEAQAIEKLSLIRAEITHPLDKLKDARPHLNPLFDLFGEKEVLSEELKGKGERLSQLETAGKEIKLRHDEIEKSLSLIPENIKELEEKVAHQKNELSLKLESKQRALIKSEEINKHIEHKKQEIEQALIKIKDLQEFAQRTQNEIFPLEATLKLQEVLNATALCIDHALSHELTHCPVCEGNVPSGQWVHLKEKLAKTDLESIRLRFEEGSKVLYKTQEEEKFHREKLQNEKQSLNQKEEELSLLRPLFEMELPSLDELDQKLTLLRQQSWERTTLLKDLEIKRSELAKTREQYAKLRSEMLQREELLHEKDEKLKALIPLLHNLVLSINRDTIRELKLAARNLQQYLESENNLEKITQEKSYLLTEQNKTALQRNTHEHEAAQELQKIKVLKAELTEALQGEKASERIRKLNNRLQEAHNEWANYEQKKKNQELILKDLNGRMYPLSELAKDYDLQFTKELHAVRERASLIESGGPSRFKDLDLSLDSPRELFIPLKDLLSSRKDEAKNLVNECRMSFASVSTRLTDWEKLQDKIQLLELKARDINEALARKNRLFEVLGKDDLRTFVLSLVEENLIHQTNEELKRLCQGRYEIVHQTRALKMTPEFFILDKFREGGRRKVSTLSGGETFMVSLAMALALAEMTRGQAEIDSLFIDEGFGTLDQESLEDVLDMLGQIQNRGLMVGVISHIKTLTNALPVNLVLNKKQDGTSTIRLQFN